MMPPLLHERLLLLDVLLLRGWQLLERESAPPLIWEPFMARR